MRLGGRALAGFFILAILCALATAAETPTILHIGHVTGPASIYSQTLAEFDRRLHARLGDKVSIDIQGGSKLGNEGELLRKVRDGEAVFTVVSPVATELDDQFGVFDMPYLVLTRDHLKARRSKLLHDFLEPAARKKGVRLLALWENGFRHITNNIKPIEAPKDLQGLKLRVPTGRWQSIVFSAFGAQPIALQFDKLPEAIQKNEVDGQENPLTQINGAKLYDIQTYLSLTSHVYLPAYFFVNEKYYQSLPSDVRTAIAETAKGMEDWVLDLGDKLDVSLRAELSKRMIVNDVDKLSFILASLPIYKQFAKSVPNGKALIKLMYDASSLKSQR